MKSRHKKNPVIKFIFLSAIFIIIAYFAFVMYKRYSFTKERADLAKYLGVSGQDVAIYLNDILQNHYDTDIRYKFNYRIFLMSTFHFLLISYLYIQVFHYK